MSDLAKTAPKRPIPIPSNGVAPVVPARKPAAAASTNPFANLEDDMSDDEVTQNLKATAGSSPPAVQHRKRINSPAGKANHRNQSADWEVALAGLDVNSDLGMGAPDGDRQAPTPPPPIVSRAAKPGAQAPPLSPRTSPKRDGPSPGPAIPRRMPLAPPALDGVHDASAGAQAPPVLPSRPPPNGASDVPLQQPTAVGTPDGPGTGTGPDAIRELQAAIQALKDQNNILEQQNKSLQLEFVGVQGDREFLERTLKRRTAREKRLQEASP